VTNALGFLSPEARQELEQFVVRLVDERLRVAGADRAEPEWLTVPEAAERIRASRQRIYDLCSEGRLRRYKDGSRLLLSRREVDGLVAGGGSRE
jgi:excisionase family DNA binding protein